MARPYETSSLVEKLFFDERRECAIPSEFFEAIRLCSSFISIEMHDSGTYTEMQQLA
jgi:hypothetical protein